MEPAPIEETPFELDIQMIATCLSKSLISDNEERKRCGDYLSQCETNSNFSLSLLQIFVNPSQTDPQIKFQSLICLKNVILRGWHTSRGRHLFRANISMCSHLVLFLLKNFQ
jgi:hypothetical protein